jgi:hypothetical protein
VGFGVGIGPRLFRVRVGTSGVGVSSGLGPFSVWASTGSGRRRRRNHVSVRATGVRYLTDPGAHIPLPCAPGVPMADVTGFDANALTPTAPGDLVAQLNAAAHSWRWPWALVATFVAVSVGLLVTWLFAVVMLLVGIALTVCLLLLEPRHKVEVIYEVEGSVAHWFLAMTAGWSQLGGAWRINTKGAVQTTYHHKINSGASHLVSRSRVHFGTRGPKILVANVPVPSLSSESHSLHMLPGIPGVGQPNRVGSVERVRQRADGRGVRAAVRR